MIFSRSAAQSLCVCSVAIYAMSLKRPLYLLWKLLYKYASIFRVCTLSFIMWVLNRSCFRCPLLLLLMRNTTPRKLHFSFVEVFLLLNPTCLLRFLYVTLSVHLGKWMSIARCEWCIRLFGTSDWFCFVLKWTFENFTKSITWALGSRLTNYGSTMRWCRRSAITYREI